MRTYDKAHEVFGGWVLLDSKGFSLTGDDLMPILFPSKEAAEEAAPIRK